MKPKKSQTKEESAKSFNAGSAVANNTSYGEYHNINVRYHFKDGPSCLYITNPYVAQVVDRKLYTERNDNPV